MSSKKAISSRQQANKRLAACLMKTIFTEQQRIQRSEIRMEYCNDA
jgi:hypothetical protein